ncbi:hypothetical protein ET445_01365 [Agromyces protaetiae]|uniref:Uncharacterized protein n=1 Tax=Agromyces protaetiae TaxID=2509455 RepID=A0A4P6FEQ1_9MICO|nr:hypothetical protein [Agromyces protaetiae]QAY72187.1 hypothetical protein ET445_01365 [Agromyces protaetiae]
MEHPEEFSGPTPDNALSLGPTPGFHPDGTIDPTAFKTASDEAFFWSGRSNGIGGADVAGVYASDFGGTTLEQLMERRGIEMPEWNPDDPDVVGTWKAASAA